MFRQRRFFGRRDEFKAITVSAVAELFVFNGRVFADCERVNFDLRGHALDLINTNMATGNEDTKMILEAIQQDPYAIERHRDEARLARVNIDTKTTVVNAPVTSGGTVIS